MSASESDRGILVADIPTQRIDTLYSALGDWPVLILSLMALAGAAIALILNLALHNKFGEPK